MKQILKLSLLLLALLLPATATAHDFEVDGIYYNINGNEVLVTCKGAYFHQYSNEYTGDVVIPTSVNYNGVTYSVRTIDGYAFDGCTELTSISIPNSVNYIGRDAFNGCTGLTSADIPNSITYIGENAFSGCSALTNIEIPNSLTIIRNSTFQGCAKLTSVTIPNSVTKIEQAAFGDCSSLTSIHIPTSVSTINYFAFSNCPSLESITVANDNQNYDSRDNCNAIIQTSTNELLVGCKNTIIPNSVTYINDCAFYGCTGLTSINIPGSVTLISGGTFSTCTSLTNITVASDNPIFDSRNNCNAIIQTSTNELIVGCKSTTIPNSVTSIGDNAFEHSGLTYINIPNSVTTIGSSAFADCTELTNINLSNSISIISFNAFQNCSSLTSIEIPDSVKGIDPQAFMGCSSLTDVHIPSSVKRIGWAVFAYCPSLNSITVANDNPYFDSRDNCNAIIQKAYTLYNPTSDVILVAGCKNTVIPDSVTVFDFASFAGCTSLDSITIPSSITTICDYAFQDCSSLSEINIPSSVTAIAEGAFSGCTTLNNVYCHISDPTAINMGSEVFVRNPQNYAERTLYVPIGSLGVYQTDRKWSQYFGNIVEIDVSPHIVFADANVKAICVQNWDTNGDGELSHLEAAAVTSLNNAFSNNNTITSFDELEYFTGLSSINDYEFNYCTGLTSVTIPNSVTIIGEQAFNECTSLTSITIPNSITHIGFLAFDSTPWYNNQPDGVIYVGLVAYKYKGTMPEGTGINIKESTLVIDDFAFWYCNGLVSVTIPNSVTTIGEEAFSHCTNLTSINIPNSVTTINKSAFSGCSRLTNFTIPNSITTIANFAFSETGLINVIIPNSVTTIGDGAFSGCTALNDITIPNSVTNINVGAFYGCTGLSNINIPESVLSIAHYAFNECTNLTTIICKALIPPTIDYETFTSFTPTLYVPKASLEAYRTANIWKQFQTILPIEGNIVNDYLSMDGITALYGDTIVIPVKMFNEASIISFQTDIFLPEGLELLQEDGEYVIDPSERMTRTHSISSNDVSNGAVRVICYSSNYKPFTGNSGDDLFYLTVKMADDAEGDYAIQLRNTLLTTSNFEEIAAPDVAANVYVKSYLLGDANNSRTVTITDVVVTSQYVLEMNPQPFVFEAADVNFDGNITVTDVSRIAWMVLNPDALNVPMRASVIMDCSDYMSGDGISLATGETRTVSIALNNAMDYTACQLDLRLPEGLEVSNFRLTDRAGSHVFDVNTLHNGDIRVLCYSPALTAIGGHEGTLLTFDVTATAPVTGDIAVDDIELVTTACQTVKPDGFVIGVNNATSVNEIAGSKTVARVEYFNLAGQQIDSPNSSVTLVVTTYTDGSRTTAKVFR